MGNWCYLLISVNVIALIAGGIWLYLDYNQFRFDRLSEKWKAEDSVKQTARGE